MKVNKDKIKGCSAIAISPLHFIFYSLKLWDLGITKKKQLTIILKK